MKAALTLLAVLAAAGLAAAAPAVLPRAAAYNQTSAVDRALSANGLTSYGRHCGAGHGAIFDCCDGKPCPACSANDRTLTAECLRQCPPVDELDHACAWHDYCCEQNRKSISCSPEGNRCMCDCKLINSAETAKCGSLHCSAFRDALLEVFKHTLACFYYDDPQRDRSACTEVQCSAGWCNVCKGDEKCDGLVGGKYEATDFCDGGFPSGP